MQKLFTILLMTSSVFTSAQNSKTAAPLNGWYTINGELQGAAKAKIYLREAAYFKEENAADSTVADNRGRFTFKGIVQEVSPFIISVKGKPGMRLFILENSTINIKGKADAIAKAELTGSKEDEIYNKVSIIQDELYKLEETYSEAKEKKDTAAMRVVASKRDAMIKQGKDFIATYPTFFASIELLGYFVNSDRIAEADELLQTFKQTAKKPTEQLGFFEKLITTRKSLSKGNTAPDFAQPDTAGNIVALSSYRGNFILLDFWASWCLPCRKENPNLVNAYKRFSSKNFSIISVSLDKDKDDWLKAVRKDGLTWTHVSDLKGQFNKVKEMYAVMGIPDNYLIDPSGKIIAKGLHGEELQKVLEQVLK